MAEVLAAVFRRAAADTTTIPDGPLLKGPIVEVRDVFGKTARKVPKEALRGLTHWVLRSNDELQQEADAANAPQYFVTVESVALYDDTAVVQWGTDIQLPSRMGGIVTCCEIATDRYSRRGTSWVFTKRLTVYAY